MAEIRSPDGARILVVDDDRAVRSALRINLAKAGMEVFLASSADEALVLLNEQAVDVVLSDVKMPGSDGIALLKKVRKQWPDTRMVMMTGQGTVQNAVEAMKAGASDYLIKPASKDEVLVILKRALHEKALSAQVVQLRREVEDRFGMENIIGATPEMQEVFTLIVAVADSDARVLVTGATGTGKELVAHAIHHRSPRRDAPFVAVNCAALPEGLLESELFGHEKGAFTGAVRQHRGKFEQASGGTLFLDEVGEIPLSTQVRLLRVLESGSLQRVGGQANVRVDVRVVTATNRDLRNEVKQGRFRDDLFYRLNVFHIPLPPLARRMDDLPLLVDHFVRRFAERYGKEINRVSPSVMDQFMAHHWPGNVRELQHVIERAVILCPDDQVNRVKLPEPTINPDEGIPGLTLGGGLSPTAVDQNIVAAMQETERRLIINALRAEKGVQARAARRLGISRSNLNYRIQKLQIVVTDVVIE